ncbi:vimentin-type intermediate filament-associated coiled-coil protein isoform X2 [Echinops telfairi]|uniref:Vimentin-type intermediate filament-associated coiled-coil protein isoform X2 n=1 Tax=Echinops telfairi TaxID=9371 RepID=A0AC55DWG1_ECHTE|nr:vimentin-type intermediate filament-associated coiled-coil protein isoform X2 [Echinops telfairi]
MSAPPALQIREANAHLAAMHRRAVELEARLDAAECTVRAQAERLACHDQQLRAALEELGHAKDCEIATLREQLMTSEAAVHNLQATVRQRDDLIGQLQLQAELLRDVCQHRLPLARLLATLDEAERLGSLPSRDPCGPSPAIVSTNGEGDEDHLPAAVLGTTVTLLDLEASKCETTPCHPLEGTLALQPLSTPLLNKRERTGPATSSTPPNCPISLATRFQPPQGIVTSGAAVGQGSCRLGKANGHLQRSG